MRPASLVLAVGLFWASYSTADAPPMPANANVTASVDVAAILKSPYGQQHRLSEKVSADAWALPLPADASRLRSAASLNLATLQPRWQASWTNTERRFDPNRAKGLLGGYIDRIAGKELLCVDGEVYVMQASPGLVASLWASDRQQVAHWIGRPGEPGQPGQPASPGTIASSPDDRPESEQFAVNVDLSDGYSPAGIFHAIRNGGFASLDKYEGDIATLAEALASVNRLRLSARFANGIQGQLAVTFEKDISELGPYAKAFVLDAAAEAGLPASDLEKWVFTAKGSQLTGEGAISEPSLRHMAAFFLPPSHALPGGETGEAADPKKLKGEASLRYYQSVSRLVDGLNFRQASLQQTAAYLRGLSLQIQRLPILNVDPALQAWGSQLTEALNHAAQTSASAQLSAIAGSQSVASPVAATVDAYGYSSTSTAQSRADFRNAQQQRREAGTSQRASAISAVTSIMEAAVAPRPKIRQDMTAAYGIEF